LTPVPIKSPWQDLNLHFKLRYDLGYRYLDRCGELMVFLEQELGFVPSDTVPSGAKLELPEDRIYVELDSTELRIRQENPSDAGAAMVGCAELLSRKVLEFFSPALPTSSGFASKSYRLLKDEFETYEASVKADGDLHRSLATELGVSPRNQELHHVFQTGSYELRFNLKPVALNTPQRSMFTPGFNPSERLKKLTDRKNKAIESSIAPFSGYGLLLEVDLREENPAASAFKSHFDLMDDYKRKLEIRYSLQS
jgi:hypothetical protein